MIFCILGFIVSFLFFITKYHSSHLSISGVQQQQQPLGFVPVKKILTNPKGYRPQHHSIRIPDHLPPLPNFELKSRHKGPCFSYDSTRKMVIY
jgi:hypothetical protein